MAQQGIGKTAEHTQQLCQYSRNSGSGRTHAEGDKEQDIQSDIEQCRENQEYQRRDRISERSQDSADEIVAHLGKDAEEDDETVDIGGVIHRLVDRRNMNKSQHPWQKHDRQHGQNNRYAERQVDLCREGAPHAPPVARAYASSGQNGKPCRTAEGELQEDEGQRERVVDPCHLLRRQHLPADDRIGQYIDLLEQVGNHNRYGIAQDDAPGRSRRQIDRLGEPPEQRCALAVLGFCCSHIPVPPESEIGGIIARAPPVVKVYFSRKYGKRKSSFLERLRLDSERRTWQCCRRWLI